MSEIVRYQDGSGQCWARIDLDNGDPIWISVAKNSVIVKKSRMGLFGKKLLNEKTSPQLFEALVRLNDSLKEFHVPKDIQHPALRRLTNVALVSESTSELLERLKYVMNQSA